ncbi:MAG: hypothetical protein R6U29_02705, partial [Desulfosudaceae bacterium]
MATFITTAIIAFIMAIAVIELTLYAYRNYRYPDRAKIGKRLSLLSADRYAHITADIVKKRTLSEVPALNALLNQMAWAHRLERFR